MNKKCDRYIRIIRMIFGIFLISVSVAGFRIAGLGVDAFTGMNLGISGFTGWSFGNCQLLVNAAILIIVFFTMRQCIGIGTVINMVFVGYIADFLCGLLPDALQAEAGLPLRIVFLAAALLFASMGVAFYMTADMGIAPYDSAALIIEKLSKGKIPFQAARVSSDITVLLIGGIFCGASGHKIWMVIGVGTVCNALLNGPMIRFFKEKLAVRFLAI